jgi:fermentation-respiration switch protein FrsA (DUF1100 family)
MTLCRSLLFAPANHARRVEKALTLAADAVILDLEDAVAVAEKPAARQAVLAALARPRRCRFYVRVNAMGTEWGYADLVGVVVPGVDGIVLPKLESALSASLRSATSRTIIFCRLPVAGTSRSRTARAIPATFLRFGRPPGLPLWPARNRVHCGGQAYPT